MSPTYKLFFFQTWWSNLSLIIHVTTFVQVGDFVSNELGMDLLGDALEPTKILGGTEFWGAGIEA